MRRGVAQGIFGIFALLLIGALLGASVTMIYTGLRLKDLEERSQLDARTWLLNTLTERLELSDTQADTIARIYDDGVVARTLGSIKARPVFGRPRFEFLQEVYQQLNPEQQVLFNSFMRLRFEKSRTFGLSDLIVRLDLTFEEVEQVEVILARHVTNDLIKYQSVTSMFARLLSNATSDLQNLLPEAKARELQRYQIELSDELNRGSR